MAAASLAPVVCQPVMPPSSLTTAFSRFWSSAEPQASRSFAHTVFAALHFLWSLGMISCAAPFVAAQVEAHAVAL